MLVGLQDHQINCDNFPSRIHSDASFARIARIHSKNNIIMSLKLIGQLKLNIFGPLIFGAKSNDTQFDFLTFWQLNKLQYICTQSIRRPPKMSSVSNGQYGLVLYLCAVHRHKLHDHRAEIAAGTRPNVHARTTK